jgi:hypothetical protein
MITVESVCSEVKLTPECLSVTLLEPTIQELKNFVSEQPILREVVDSLLRWVDYPTVWLRDIVSVSLVAIPVAPTSEHLLSLSILARCPGGQRTYEIHLKPEDAKRIASEIESRILKRF